jgi:phospholipid/cholesterol/gamma-HCH transport system permease protein
MSVPGFSLACGDGLDGMPSIRLSGRVTLADGNALWDGLRGALAGRGAVEVDLEQVERLDGGAAALLHAAARLHRAQGGTLRFVGAHGETAQLLALYACADGPDCERQAPSQPGLLNDVGNFAVDAVHSTRAILAFSGDLVHGVVQAIRRPRSVHFGELGRLIERAGMDGVPIIALINFLVGAVLGLQGAIQLHRFGGDQFLASLVGLSVVREFGPLMTAILVAGRSGAGYAAELGTMTVNEEIDALRTLGQDPQRFLVFPRVLTLLLVVPVLTLLANFAGIVGGLVVAVAYLEQPTVVYVQNLQAAADLGDVGTGLLKSVAFAVAIGLVACQRGLSTRGGAAGVGNATTSAVVAVLFTLVVLDAVFTNAFSMLGW